MPKKNQKKEEHVEEVEQELEPVSSDEGFDASSLISLPTDEEVQKAVQTDKFASLGKTTMAADEKYLEFDSQDLVKISKPVLRLGSSKNLVSRTVRITAFESSTKIEATDGVSYLYFSLATKNNKFPNSCIVNFESLWRAARPQPVLYLVSRDEQFYVAFFGNFIFVPSYKFEQDCFTPNLGNKIGSKSILASDYLNTIQAIMPVISGTDVPEYGFIHFCQGHAFGTNGSLTVKVQCDAYPHILRHKDAVSISGILEGMKESHVTVSLYEKFVALEVQGMSYIYPRVDISLSTAVLDFTKQDIKYRYYVSVPFLGEFCSMASHMPDSSQVVDVEAVANQLVSTISTKRGDRSKVVLSSSFDGELKDPVTIGLSVKTLSVVFSCFRNSDNIAFTPTPNGVHFKSGNSHMFMAK